MNQTITVTYLDEKLGTETFTGTVKVMTCGVLEITEDNAEQTNSLIATIATKKVIGIPLAIVRKYEVS